MRLIITFLVAVILLSISSVHAQIIYSDEFDDNLTTESNAAYAVTLENGNLQIIGNGTAGAYNAFEYDVHDNGTLTTLDMSSAPQLYIKARGTGAPILRMDARDLAGYATNLQANYASLTDQFAIYTLDFTGDFLDGGYGGSPCLSDDAPCAVDPETIANFVFFVNDAAGGYEGTIEIDWISVGEPLEEEEPPVILYSDEFDANLTIESNDAYAVSLDSGVLNILGNGTAGPYTPLVYGVHDSGNTVVLDMSSNPRIYIKAKGSDFPSLRVDVQDEAGYVTNLQANFAALTDDYGIYTLDFAGDFLDGGFGGSPCTAEDAPCPVDPTAITEFVFFINDANGGYEGLIEIDWISVGVPLEDALPEGRNIRYNQYGYHLQREKLINVTGADDFEPMPFTIFDESGAEVLNGMSSSTDLWPESNEFVSTIDFSSLDSSGAYVMVVDEDEVEFTIVEDGYEELSAATFKYYYYNRASTEITAEFGGAYARNAGLLDTEVLIHPSAASASRPAGTVISAPKGWFDAGDYNKYIVNSGISTYTLLAAFEHFNEYLALESYDIPENTNDLPDLLDEVKWNLDWMLAMQDPEDGGVYHKLTGLNFSGIIMPDEYSMDRYVVQKTTSAALNLAAVAAIASRTYAAYEEELPGYSAQLLAAAQNAYQWAQANPTIYYQQPSDVQTGQYEDNNVTDEFQWAAVELFITTGDDSYSDTIDVTSIGNGMPFWQYTAPLALYSIAANSDSVEDDLDVDTAIAKIIETATSIKEKVETSAMRVGMGSGDFNWGSNGQAGNQIMSLLMAYQVSDDDSFLDAAFTASDYILGRNATGYSFISGYGDRPMNNPHHRISEADTVEDAVPGMVAGGPHSGQQDGCSGYPSTVSARSYVDDWCSYSTNEVTINWNAPFFYAFTALHLFQNETALSITDAQPALTEHTLILYPNPSVDVLNLRLLDQGNVEVQIFDLNGRQVMNINLKEGDRALDISKIPTGMYLLQTTASGKELVQKFIKQ